jgi:sigma-B regulation protein RsbQ
MPAAAERHNVRFLGQGPRLFVLSHGFGCDQSVWKSVAPTLAEDSRVLLFDLAGAGRADPALYDRARHSTLRGYAEDVIRLLDDLGLRKVDFVGHSVSGMIGAIAAMDRPDLFRSLVMVGPSACYLNVGAYRGGFDRDAVEELLDLLDQNFLGFAAAFSPLATGNPERPETAAEFAERMCRTDPEVASAFARVTFFSDCRDILPKVPVPALVLQCRDDPIAPDEAIRFVHDALPDSRLVRLEASGHCPQISHPAELVRVLRDLAAETPGGAGDA